MRCQRPRLYGRERGRGEAAGRQPCGPASRDDLGRAGKRIGGAAHWAQAQGELAPDKDPRSLARFLLVVLQGLRVVSKARSDPQRFRDAAKEALGVLA